MARPKKAVEPLYKATLKNRGLYHTGTGKTLIEALNNIEIRNAKGASALTIQKGDQEQIRVFPSLSIQRAFNTKGLIHDIALQGIASRFAL